MYIRTVVTALAIAIGTSSCGQGGTADSPQAMSESDRAALWTIQMQKRVAAKLKDPDSAKFRNTTLSKKGGVPAVCGEVNASNSFGGKAGFQRFISAGDIQVLEEEMEPGAMEPVWKQFCQ